MLIARNDDYRNSTGKKQRVHNRKIFETYKRDSIIRLSGEAKSKGP